MALSAACTHCRKRRGRLETIWLDVTDYMCEKCYAAWVALYDAALGRGAWPDVPPAPRLRKNQRQQLMPMCTPRDPLRAYRRM